MAISPIPLTSVPEALASKGYEPPSYWKVYRAAIDARIPVVRNDRGRRGVLHGDLDKIAQVLSLTRADARAAA